MRESNFEIFFEENNLKATIRQVQNSFVVALFDISNGYKFPLEKKFENIFEAKKCAQRWIEPITKDSISLYYSCGKI